MSQAASTRGMSVRLPAKTTLASSAVATADSSAARWSPSPTTR